MFIFLNKTIKQEIILDKLVTGLDKMTKPFYEDGAI